MKKVFLVGIIALSLVALFTSFNSTVSAEEGPENRFGKMSMHGMGRGLELKAEFFGISVEELQSKFDEGKTMLEISEELDKNFDDMRTFMLEKAQERWQEMGLSQEEIDERMQRMEERHTNCEGDHEQLGRTWEGRGYGKN